MNLGGSNAVPSRQEAPHAHCFQPDIQGNFVYTCDLGSDRVWGFKIHPEATGNLIQPIEQFGTVTPPGSGPRHMTFHPNDKFVYVGCELDNTVIFFEKGENGSLTQKQIITTLPEKDGEPRYVSDIHCAEDGKFLYVSNRDTGNKGGDTIAIFRIDQSTGNLSIIGHESTRGMIPRGFRIDGKYMFVGNQESSTIVPYGIDENSGKLEFCGDKFNSPTPVCIRIVEFDD